MSVLTERKQATFSAGVQVAILSLMHDLFDSQNHELFPEGDTYSTYSLGIFLGIFAVALDLLVAIVAAANVAMASYLSFHPPREKFNFESNFQWRLIFCMIMQFATAIVSGNSLILFSLNIGIIFSICVGCLFLMGFSFLVHSVFLLFGVNRLKHMLKLKAPLSALSLVLSTLAFILVVCLRNQQTLWFTVFAYFFTLIYQLFIHSQRIPIEKPEWMYIGLSFLYCFLWMLLSLWLIASNFQDPLAIIANTASGLEGILFTYIAVVGVSKKWGQHRRHIRGSTSPV